MKRMKLIISCNLCYPLAIKETTNDTNVTNDSCSSCHSLLKKSFGGLFVLHKLVSLCHTVIELATAIHINLCFDRLL